MINRLFALLIALITSMGYLAGPPLAEDGYPMPLFEYLDEDSWAEPPPISLMVQVNHCLYSEAPIVYTDPAVIDEALALLGTITVTDGVPDTRVSTGSDTVYTFASADGNRRSVAFQNGKLLDGYGEPETSLLAVDGLGALAHLASPDAALLSLEALLRNDQPYDGLGVYWDGEKAALDGDDMDEHGLLDGRGGPYEIIDHEVLDDTLTLSCPVWPQDVLADTAARYEAADARWYVLVQRDASGAPGTALLLDSYPIDGGDVRVYLCLYEAGGVTYAGYTTLVTVDEENLALSMGHIGNMSDLQVMLGFLLQSLDIT